MFFGVDTICCDWGAVQSIAAWPHVFIIFLLLFFIHMVKDLHCFAIKPQSRAITQSHVLCSYNYLVYMLWSWFGDAKINFGCTDQPSRMPHENPTERHRHTHTHTHAQSSVRCVCVWTGGRCQYSCTDLCAMFLFRLLCALHSRIQVMRQRTYKYIVQNAKKGSKVLLCLNKKSKAKVCLLMHD